MIKLIDILNEADGQPSTDEDYVKMFRKLVDSRVGNWGADSKIYGVVQKATEGLTTKEAIVAKVRELHKAKPSTTLAVLLGKCVNDFKTPLAEAKKEEPKVGAFEEFADKRLGGAEKITNNSKEKGGLSMLTYYHYNAKLPYYKKAAEGKLDLEAAHKEYKDLIKQLHTATKTNMNIEQIAFQKLVGKIEVLGELLIKHK